MCNTNLVQFICRLKLFPKTSNDVDYLLKIYRYVLKNLLHSQNSHTAWDTVYKIIKVYKVLNIVLS